MSNKFDSPKASKAVAALQKRGFEIDEIESLCDDEEALFKMLRDLLKAESAAAPLAEDDADDGDEPEDDYRLPESEVENQSREEKEGDVREAKDRFEKEPVKSDEVTFEDFMKSLDEGLTADDKNVPNN